MLSCIENPVTSDFDMILSKSHAESISNLFHSFSGAALAFGICSASFIQWSVIHAITLNRVKGFAFIVLHQLVDACNSLSACRRA